MLPERARRRVGVAHDFGGVGDGRRGKHDPKHGVRHCALLQLGCIQLLQRVLAVVKGFRPKLPSHLPRRILGALLSLLFLGVVQEPAKLAYRKWAQLERREARLAPQLLRLRQLGSEGVGVDDTLVGRRLRIELKAQVVGAFRLSAERLHALRRHLGRALVRRERRLGRAERARQARRAARLVGRRVVEHRRQRARLGVAAVAVGLADGDELVGERLRVEGGALLFDEELHPPRRRQRGVHPLFVLLLAQQGGGGVELGLAIAAVLLVARLELGELLSEDRHLRLKVRRIALELLRLLSEILGALLRGLLLGRPNELPIRRRRKLARELRRALHRPRAALARRQRLLEQSFVPPELEAQVGELLAHLLPLAVGDSGGAQRSEQLDGRRLPRPVLEDEEARAGVVAFARDHPSLLVLELGAQQRGAPLGLDAAAAHRHRRRRRARRRHAQPRRAAARTVGPGRVLWLADGFDALRARRAADARARVGRGTSRVGGRPTDDGLRRLGVASRAARVARQLVHLQRALLPLRAEVRQHLLTHSRVMEALEVALLDRLCHIFRPEVRRELSDFLVDVLALTFLFVVEAERVEGSERVERRRVQLERFEQFVLSLGIDRRRLVQLAQLGFRFERLGERRPQPVARTLGLLGLLVLGLLAIEQVEQRRGEFILSLIRGRVRPLFCWLAEPIDGGAEQLALALLEGSGGHALQLHRVPYLGRARADGGHVGRRADLCARLVAIVADGHRRVVLLVAVLSLRQRDLLPRGGPVPHGLRGRHDADGAAPRADQREGGGALLARQLAVELVAIVLVLPSVAARAAAVDEAHRRQRGAAPILLGLRAQRERDVLQRRDAVAAARPVAGEHRSELLGLAHRHVRRRREEHEARRRERAARARCDRGSEVEAAPAARLAHRLEAEGEPRRRRRVRAHGERHRRRRAVDEAARRRDGERAALGQDRPDVDRALAAVLRHERRQRDRRLEAARQLQAAARADRREPARRRRRALGDVGRRGVVEPAAERREEHDDGGRRGEARHR